MQKFRYGYNPTPRSSQSDQVARTFQKANLKPEWITRGADKDLVDFAEKMGTFMGKNGLTTSQIRNFYGEIKRIQSGTFEKNQAAFYLLRPKLAYARGRFPDQAGLELFKNIVDAACPLVKDNATFNNFCNLIEAVLAYHRFTNPKDK